MDIKCIVLISCYFGLISHTKANFPFQPGPILFDPYAPFFGAPELNPFASNDIHLAISTNRYPRGRHRDRPPNRHNDKSLKGYNRKYNSDSKPTKWKNLSEDYKSNGLSVKDQSKPHYNKVLSPVPPVPKYNSNNKVLNRPKPETDISVKNRFPYQTNNFYSKPKFNYKNSNSFRQSVPRKPIINSRSHSLNIKTKPNDSPMSFDIDLNGEDEDDDDEDEDLGSNYRSQNKSPKNKIQYLSPPKEFTNNRPQSYLIKERIISSDFKPKRPALYEMEPPRNLNKGLNGPAFIQNIPVPHKTLMEIAKITGPPNTNTNVRRHPFEGFYQNQKPKPDSEIIVNALGDDMSTARQVGASMTVQLDERKVAPKGKIFDEPLNDDDRRYGKSYTKDINTKNFDSENYSYSQKPFRPNDRNPFNSKHFHTFSDQKSINNDLNSDNNEENDNSFTNSKSNDDYKPSDREDTNEYSNNKRPLFESFNNNEPQSRVQESEAEKTEDEKTDDEEEWSSNGIPGQAGKDYPMLSSVPTRSVFSCMGRPHGFYADVSQKCQVYHQCAAQGQQRFLCPNGTLFNQESLVCEWWYNVFCENSEKLYHKNAELYSNDKQNDENSNDNENKEYNKSWNTNYNPNHRHNHHNNYHNNHHNNHNHNHYSHNHNRDTKKFRSDFNRKELHSSAPDLHYDHQRDDDIDVDLSDDESRNRLYKTKSTQQLVSNWKPLNITRDIVFVS